MALNYARLRIIHGLLRQRADLTGQLERCPRQILNAESAVAACERAVEDAKSQWQECKKIADGKQLTLNQREAKLVDFKGKLNACSSNREFQLLKDQIAADEKANSVLADEILEMLERADGLNSKISEARDKLSRAQQELSRVKEEVSKREKFIVGELTVINRDLQAEESHLGGEFLTAYRRRVESNQENALAVAEEQTCGNCYQHLSVQTMSELYQQKEVTCKGCGAILYITEEALANREL